MKQAALSVAATGLGSSLLGHQGSMVGEGQLDKDRFDPWIEVDRAALWHNVEEVHRLGGGRPILAVVKNNAYGLGLIQAGSYLESRPEIAGFAVVKAASAFALRDAGITKPIHLMARVPQTLAAELVHRNIQPCLYSEDDFDLIAAMSGRKAAPISAQVYLDTGMSRMGMPYRKALPWLTKLHDAGMVAIEGMFMGFTEIRILMSSSWIGFYRWPSKQGRRV